MGILAIKSTEARDMMVLQLSSVRKSLFNAKVGISHRAILCCNLLFQYFLSLAPCKWTLLYFFELMCDCVGVWVTAVEVILSQLVLPSHSITCTHCACNCQKGQTFCLWVSIPWNRGEESQTGCHALYQLIARVQRALMLLYHIVQHLL